METMMLLALALQISKSTQFIERFLQTASRRNGPGSPPLTGLDQMKAASALIKKISGAVPDASPKTGECHCDKCVEMCGGIPGLYTPDQVARLTDDQVRVLMPSPFFSSGDPPEVIFGLGPGLTHLPQGVLLRNSHTVEIEELYKTVPRDGSVSCRCVHANPETGCTLSRDEMPDECSRSGCGSTRLISSRESAFAGWCSSNGFEQMSRWSSLTGKNLDEMRGEALQDLLEREKPGSKAKSFGELLPVGRFLYGLDVKRHRRRVEVKVEKD